MLLVDKLQNFTFLSGCTERGIFSPYFLLLTPLLLKNIHVHWKSARNRIYSLQGSPSQRYGAVYLTVCAPFHHSGKDLFFKFRGSNSKWRPFSFVPLNENLKIEMLPSHKLPSGLQVGPHEMIITLRDCFSVKIWLRNAPKIMYIQSFTEECMDRIILVKMLHCKN